MSPNPTADYKRIDWLGEIAEEVEITIRATAQSGVVISVGRIPITGPTIRAALDAAMAATQ